MMETKLALANIIRKFKLIPSENTIEPFEPGEIVTKSLYGKDFSIVRVPYAFKLLMQELTTMNVQMRIITEQNVDQIMSSNLIVAYVGSFYGTKIIILDP